VSGTSTLNSALDEATRRVIHSMSVTDLAELTRIPRRHLYMLATPASYEGDEHRDLRAKLIPALTLATGHADILDVLAVHSGGVFVKRPAPTHHVDAAVQLHVASVIGASADLMREASVMLIDNRITAEERAHLHQQITELQAEAEALRLRIDEAAVDELARRPLAKAAAR
jgi:hypothetical protein